MAHDAEFQKLIQRIGEIVERLDASADPNVRSMAKELLESLMALHGATLERILELTSDAGESGQTIIANCGQDELVSSVLILYGLHPDDLRTRVTRTLEKSRSYFKSHSATAELLSISDEGAVTVRLDVKSVGCGSSAASVKSTLETALQEAAPDATSIIVRETGAALIQSGFVPIAALGNCNSLSASPAVQIDRSAD